MTMQPITPYELTHAIVSEDVLIKATNDLLKLHYRPNQPTSFTKKQLASYIHASTLISEDAVMNEDILPLLQFKYDGFEITFEQSTKTYTFTIPPTVITD